MSYYELGLKMLQTKKSFSMKVCLLANKLNEIFYTRDLTGINGDFYWIGILVNQFDIFCK